MCQRLSLFPLFYFHKIPISFSWPYWHFLSIQWLSLPLWSRLKRWIGIPWKPMRFCLLLSLRTSTVLRLSSLWPVKVSVIKRLTKNLWIIWKNPLPIVGQRVSKRLWKRLPISCSMSAFSGWGLFWSWMARWVWGSWLPIIPCWFTLPILWKISSTCKPNFRQRRSPITV